MGMQALQGISSAAKMDGVSRNAERAAGRGIQIQYADIVIDQKDGNGNSIHNLGMSQVNGGAHIDPRGVG